MMSIERASRRSVEVLPAARDQQSVLANMLELYAYDLSKAFDLHLGSDGRYGYDSLPLYWKEETRLPFLIKVDGRLSGFALVSRGSLVSGNRSVWDMAEFFVLKRYRRLGVGAMAAQELWRRLPGQWEVRVLKTNEPALLFWQTTIAAFTGAKTEPVPVEQGGRLRLSFAFESSGSVAPNNALQTTCEDARG